MWNYLANVFCERDGFLRMLTKLELGHNHLGCLEPRDQRHLLPTD